MIKQYKYSDISLNPSKKVIVSTRKNCDTTVHLGDFAFDLPIYASNMKSVVDFETCSYFYNKNMFYSMHRFDISIDEIHQHFEKFNFISLSVGVNKESYKQIDQLLDNKKYFITIDIANAWCDKARNVLDYIKNKLNAFVIVGNVACAEACEEITSWGADAIKVGISGGASCITKNKTGFYRPMFSTVMDCSKATHLPIIADGGIREHADIAKAIVAGAYMVMAGSLFAGYDQSAGQVIEIDGKRYKEYFGSASEFNKKERKNIEGKKIQIPYKGNMDSLLIEIKEDLQSSISYAGGNCLDDLRYFEDFLIIS